LPYHVVNSSSSSVFRIIGDQLSISRSNIIHKPPSKRKIQPLRQLISEVKSIWTLCFSSPPITFTVGCHHIARKWFRIHHGVISYTVATLVVSKIELAPIMTRDSWCNWSWTLRNSKSDFGLGDLKSPTFCFDFFPCGMGVMSGGVWGAYFASDRKVLQLRVSNFEYFKIEPSTDFNSPSQCQHQHHHSYFVKMGKHKFNSGRVCEHCAGYADSMPKDWNGKFLPC
jgi:hypothetical protein